MTVDGVLLVDKPSGPTSHDIVAGARRLYSLRSVGHAGTLDPMASGVMLLLFGDARKLSNYLSAQDKSYETRLSFGRSTDSFDRDGETTAEQAVQTGWLDPQRLRAALDVERRRQRQLPPKLSAIKVQGRPAHRRVRAGQDVALAERPVHVKELELVDASDESLTLRLRVSKGYYVRALARDLSESLGVPAHLDLLRRTQSGLFTLEQAVPWPVDSPPELMSTARAARLVLPSATLSERGVERARKGQKLVLEDFSDLPPSGADAIAWYSPEGHLVALGRQEDGGVYRVLRGMSAT